MALSNYDTLAIDHKGKPILDGTFTSNLGIAVSVYKDWLYVSDKSAWDAGGQFIKPIVMRIEHGKLTYKDVHIEAERGPQDSIMAIVWVGFENTMRSMLAIGCYGFDDNDEWVGVTHETINAFKEILTDWADGWLGEGQAKNISFDNALRFNQGDAFFANNVEGVPLLVSKPGEAEEPIMIRGLRDQD